MSWLWVMMMSWSLCCFLIKKSSQDAWRNDGNGAKANFQNGLRPARGEHLDVYERARRAYWCLVVRFGPFFLRARVFFRQKIIFIIVLHRPRGCVVISLGALSKENWWCHGKMPAGMHQHRTGSFDPAWVFSDRYVLNYRGEYRWRRS